MVPSSARAAFSTPVGADTSTPPCGTQYNPYIYSATALAACGFQTAPLVEQTPLAGGGSAYIYDLGSAGALAIKVPPPGFDITTATAAQLNEFGLPTRPPNAQDVALWAKLSMATPPPFLLGAPVANAGGNLSTDDVSRHWAGYTVSGPAGHFTSSTAVWTSPDYPPNDGLTACNSSADASIWTGIGGDTSNPPYIGQDGTSHGDFPAAQEAWEEVVPGQSSAYDLNMGMAHGDVAQAYVQYNPPSGGFADYYSGWVKDVTKEQAGATPNYVSWQYPWQGQEGGNDPGKIYTGNSAETVVERSVIGASGLMESLQRFSPITFTRTAANGVTLDQYQDQFNDPQDGIARHNVTMFDYFNANSPYDSFPYFGPWSWSGGATAAGAKLADSPGDVGTNGSFTVNHDACGNG